MRFNSINEIDEKTILQYIKEAILIEEKGLVIKPTKKEPNSFSFFDMKF